MTKTINEATLRFIANGIFNRACKRFGADGTPKGPYDDNQWQRYADWAGEWIELARSYRDTGTDGQAKVSVARHYYDAWLDCTRLPSHHVQDVEQQ
jgi:hypothetical protein